MPTPCPFPALRVLEVWIAVRPVSLVTGFLSAVSPEICDWETGNNTHTPRERECEGGEGLSIQRYRTPSPPHRTLRQRTKTDLKLPPHKSRTLVSGRPGKILLMKPQSSRSRGTHLNSFCVTLLVGCLSAALSHAIRITSTGKETLLVAEENDVEIDCKYQLEAADTGSLDIEWSIVSPDTTKQDLIILSYVHDRVFEYPSPLLGRFAFMSLDPGSGNASARIRSTRRGDTNTFQCKVKKSPGIDTMKVTVGVHVRPQTPTCWIDRAGDQEQDVRLRCVSHSGSPPLTYTWDRISGNKPGNPPLITTDPSSGTLLIRNSTDQSYGTYRCSVSNLVGQDECEVVVSATAGASKTGVIVGAVLGSLLALLLLLWILCCCRTRSGEKEEPFEIREDAAPPVSRASSTRSIRSYKAHQARKPRDAAVYSMVWSEDLPPTLSSDHRTPELPPGGSTYNFLV